MYHANDSETYQNIGDRGDNGADIQSHAKRETPGEKAGHPRAATTTRVIEECSSLPVPCIH